ncbi:MAG: hypothetical protein ACRDMV_23485 [Streptosporangiales bacterium]
MTPGQGVSIRLEHVADCPLVDRVRARLQRALEATGISAVIEEVEGPYPSPTLLIDGLDAVTGRPVGGGVCCRLDLPTTAQIAAALQRGGTR